VFACSGGNTEAFDGLCQALLQPEHPISPSQFNHSVHNAPLGYWSIATGSMQAGSSVGAYDASFAGGLLDAYAQVQLEQRPVLLVAYDTPPPLALQTFRAVLTPFSFALLLTPARLHTSRAALTQMTIHRGVAEGLPQATLERLRWANPAARSLPLLQKLATRYAGLLTLAYLPEQRLQLSMALC
jgi:hypothetical protein